MADSDTTQQVTSQTPTTKTKNPKRVAAGKAIAEKTRIAREAQKKALDEANAIIANKKAPEAAATPEAATATPEAATATPEAAITTTQWLSGISIFLSIVGIYYKREEIKVLFAKKPTQVEPTPVEPTPVEPTPVESTPVEPTPVEPTPVEPTPVEPTPVETKKEGRIRNMD